MDRAAPIIADPSIFAAHRFGLHRASRVALATLSTLAACTYSGGTVRLTHKDGDEAESKPNPSAGGSSRRFADWARRSVARSV
jgi:hypothetical protein